MSSEIDKLTIGSSTWMPQLQHNTSMSQQWGAVRVNGQITEVEQPRPRIIPRWVTIYDPCILSFFTLAILSRTIKQIGQFFLFSWSFVETQLAKFSRVYVVFKIPESVLDKCSPLFWNVLIVHWYITASKLLQRYKKVATQVITISFSSKVIRNL